jgi:hypothetical protein
MYEVSAKVEDEDREDGHETQSDGVDERFSYSCELLIFNQVIQDSTRLRDNPNPPERGDENALVSDQRQVTKGKCSKVKSLVDSEIDSKNPDKHERCLSEDRITELWIPWLETE